MSIAFDKAFEHTVGKEGGYSNHPSDRGGETMWGITIAVARDYGYAGSMKAMPMETAKEIYRKRYWDKTNLTEISKMSEPLAAKLFDIAVNMGVARAGIFLQTALNAFNQQEKLYNDILIDGDIGRNSLTALHSFYAKRGVSGSKVILRAINCLQGAFYIEISQTRKANEDFTFGWFLNRVD